MRLQRVAWHCLASWILACLAIVGTSVAASAQEYKIEGHDQAPPSEVSDEFRGALQTGGFKILDEGGKTYATFWIRKAIPASAKPGEPKGAIQFPFLAEGEVLGALRFDEEGYDYRDQAIAPGVYTIRYGLQPVNGDHLGVSVFRDYVLLLPAAKDKSLAAIPTKPLNERSAESAGTSHPAIFLLLAAPAAADAKPSLAHDSEKETWGAVFPLPLQVKDGGPATLKVKLIVVGAAEA